MKRCFAALAAVSISAILADLPAARAAQIDDVLKRLEALEQENAGLRDRVRRLEAQRQLEGGNPQTPVTQARAAAAAPPMAAYNAVPYKAPPAAPPPAFNWSGIYVGGHAGWGWQTTTVNDPFGFSGLTAFVAGEPIRDVHSDGFVGGAQAGWNYQIGQLVIGNEVTFSWSDIDGKRIDNLSATDSFTTFGTVVTQTNNETRRWITNTQWLATGSVRLGYAWDRWLVYSKGGVAASRFRYALQDVFTRTSVTSPSFFPPFVSGSTFGVAGHDMRIGWLVGAGLEWAFWNNWSAAIEYNYLDFGNEPVSFAGKGFTAGTILSTSTVTGVMGIEQKLQTLRLGVNYRFAAPPAPVVASY